MIAVFRHEITVTPEMLDSNRHVNNVEYVRWMQQIAVMHSNAVGCGPVLERLGATWFIREQRIVYDRPAFLGDEITGLTWVSEMSRVRSLRKYKFIRLKDGVDLARAETDWVFADAKTGRPRAIAEEIRDRFTVVPPDREP